VAPRKQSKRYDLVLEEIIRGGAGGGAPDLVMAESTTPMMTADRRIGNGSCGGGCVVCG
jgi:hypothetical protein